VLPIGEDRIEAAAHELAEVAAVTGAKLAIAALYGPATRDEAIRELRAAADVLEPAGVRIALEFTVYGHRRSIGEAIELCEAVGWPACGLLVDTWHIFRGGEDLAQLRALDAQQIALVHVNDGAPPSDVDGVFEGRFRRLPPGAGTFALDEFTAALDAVGYGGPISVEVLSSDLRRRPPAEGARQLLESLEA